MIRTVGELKKLLNDYPDDAGIIIDRENYFGAHKGYYLDDVVIDNNVVCLGTFGGSLIYDDNGQVVFPND